MARYAEWNKFIQNLKTDKYGYTNVNEVGIAFEKSTADVVPKSEAERLENTYSRAVRKADKKAIVAIQKAKQEVAREIFEEIDRLICKVLSDRHYWMGDMVWDVVELKMKYLESEDEE